MGSIWVTADTRTISETSFENVPGGVFSLGNIFPAGLSEQELIETYFTPQPIRDLVQYFAIGPLGSGSGHAFQPIYSPSPFPALNDPNIGPTAIVAEWATEAVIRYNALTGDLWIDTSGGNGGAVFTYDIQLTEPFVNADRFTPAHIEGLGSATINDDRIVEVGWEGIPTGNYALGSIFPAGMSESELEALINYAQFIGKPGHDVVSFDIQSSGINMSLHYVVPEPQASWLIFLSVFLFALAHHRRGITRVV